MRITTDHAASFYGVPVILDDTGSPIDYAAGIKAVRARLGLSTVDLAVYCRVSHRTVEGWEQGRAPTAAALNVMADLLRRAKTPKGARR